MERGALDRKKPSVGSVETSVIIVNYNGLEHLGDCLRSVFAQSYDGEYEIILVDNDSTDDSVPYVQKHFPNVRIVENDANRWYTGGNEDGVCIAKGEYLVFLNPDVEVDRDWLRTLLDPIKNEEVGLTTSRIVKFDQRSKLNTCGIITHYTGLGFCRGLDEDPSMYIERELVDAISGCSFAIRRDVYEEIGGFDQTFEMYLEDLDLSWRARLAGHDILYVPASVVYHKYDLSVSARKLFNLERNRYLLLSKHFRIRTLFLLLPGLVFTELLTWFYSAFHGLEMVEHKGASWLWLLRNWRTVAKKRRFVQKLRTRPDRELLAPMTVGLPLDQFGVPGIVRPALELLVSYVYYPWYRLAIDV